MAKRQRNTKRTKSDAADPSDRIPDLQSIESILGALGRERQGDAIDEAQEIMYDAWEAGDRKRRVALARKALKVSPLCADAYVLLAQETA